MIMTMTACDNYNLKPTINNLKVNVEGEGIIKVGDKEVNSTEKFSCEKGTFATLCVTADENWEFHN